MSIHFRILTRSVLASLAILAALATAARAQLVLNINPDTEQFWFTGSDTGTPAAYRTVSWFIGSGTQNSYNIVSSNNELVTGSASAINSGSLYLSPNSGQDRLGIGFNFLTAATTTLTGNGSSDTFSYSGLSAGSKDNLAAADGQSLSLAEGSGFSNLQVSVVPEPSSYALLGGLATLGFIATRRRR